MKYLIFLSLHSHKAFLHKIFDSYFLYLDLEGEILRTSLGVTNVLKSLELVFSLYRIC